jgi:cytochrome P450
MSAALLMDPRLSADATSPSYPAQTAALALVRRDYQVFAQMDPPGHTAERKLLQAEFSAPATERLRPRVQALVDALIEKMTAGRSSADLVTEFAVPLPCQAICTLLGVPESDHAAIQSWSKDISSRSTSLDAAAAMIKEFCDGYLADLVRFKNENPGDDLLSRLIVEHMRPGTITLERLSVWPPVFSMLGTSRPPARLASAWRRCCITRKSWRSCDAIRA